MSRIKAASIVQPTLDLNKHTFWDTINGIHVVGTWAHRPRQGVKWKPCLALLHAGRPVTHRHQRPVVILLDDAWRWAMHGDVGDPAHCVASTADWLEAGRLPGSPWNKADYMRIVDAINRRLPDLIAMPPRPKGETAAIGEATMLDAKTGRIIEEREIRVDV